MHHGNLALDFALVAEQQVRLHYAAVDTGFRSLDARQVGLPVVFVFNANVRFLACFQCVKTKLCNANFRAFSDLGIGATPGVSNLYLMKSFLRILISSNYSGMISRCHGGQPVALGLAIGIHLSSPSVQDYNVNKCVLHSRILVQSYHATRTRAYDTKMYIVDALCTSVNASSFPSTQSTDLSTDPHRQLRLHKQVTSRSCLLSSPS